MPRNRPGAAMAFQLFQLNPSSFPAMPAVAGCRATASLARRFCILASVGLATVLLIGGAAHAEPATIGAPQTVAIGDSIAAFVVEASQRFGIPAAWIRAVIHVESAGDVHVVSPKGAMGLMQIMPDTWAGLRLRYGLSADPFDPLDNILAGAAYLRELHDRYGSPGFLAAYNAGPARYEDYMATGRPLPDETRAYVAMVAPLIDGGAVDSGPLVVVAARSWTEAPLFAVQAKSSSSEARASSDLQPGEPSPNHPTADWIALAPQSDGLFVRISRRNPRP
jgi:hypothetical protein